MYYIAHKIEQLQSILVVFCVFSRYFCIEPQNQKL